MKKELALRTIDRCSEIGVFKMKCLEQFEGETWADQYKNLVDIVYNVEIDDIPESVKHYVLMTDEQFENNKIFAKLKIKAFDFAHRPNTVNIINVLKSLSV